MTIKEKMKKVLVDKGLSNEQADTILEEAVLKIGTTLLNYKNIWNKPVDECPKAICVAMSIRVHEVAKKWIAKNLPNAWFRPFFK